jgi:hypothetical protein
VSSDTVINKLLKDMEEAGMALFKVLSQHLPAGTGKILE